MLWLSLSLLAALSTLVSADVEFTTPKAGATLTGGNSVRIEWKDSGNGPKISELTTYDLFLCAGGNDQASIVQLVQITSPGASFSTTKNTAAGTIGVGVGASTPKNAYFFKIVSTGKGGTVTNYSPRFSISGMTGVFPQNVLDGLKDVDGTDGPPSEDHTNEGAPADPAAGDFGVEYAMQTGATRYAPMQPVPPNKITKKEHKPAYPTSSVKIATTMLPIPKQQTTVTRSQTFSVSSRENTAAAAPDPSDDMAKFLARWRD